MTLHFNYHPCWRSGDDQRVRSSAPVATRWLQPGNRTFLEVASMVVSWWIVAFYPVVHYSSSIACSDSMNTRSSPHSLLYRRVVAQSNNWTEILDSLKTAILIHWYNSLMSYQKLLTVNQHNCGLLGSFQTPKSLLCLLLLLILYSYTILPGENLGL